MDSLSVAADVLPSGWHPARRTAVTAVVCIHCGAVHVTRTECLWAVGLRLRKAGRGVWYKIVYTLVCAWVCLCGWYTETAVQCMSTGESWWCTDSDLDSDTAMPGDRAALAQAMSVHRFPLAHGLLPAVRRLTRSPQVRLCLKTYL